MSFNFLALLSGLVDQLLQVDAVETPVDVRQLLQRLPEGELAGDAHNQRLEFEYSAERRVATQLSVQLQASQLLAGPRHRFLGLRWFEPELGNNLAQGSLVGFDLGRQLPKKITGLASLVVSGRSSCKREAGGGSRKVVGEVDLEQAVLCDRHLVAVFRSRVKSIVTLVLSLHCGESDAMCALS
jgi:hypothetical protein